MVRNSMHKPHANGEGPSRSSRNGQARTKCHHVVQFYNNDAVLAGTVAAFVSAALQAGDGAVVLATKTHRDLFDDRLRAAGVNIDSARASGRYVSLDAADTLAQIMIDGQPDRERFAAVVGNLIQRVLSIAPRINSFGELVSLLWSAGKGDAAIALEKLWNELIESHESHALSLHCAYAIDDLGNHVSREHFLGVCAEHRGIIHSPSYFGAAFAREDDPVAG